METRKERPAGGAGQKWGSASGTPNGSPHPIAARDPVQAFIDAMAAAGIPPHDPGDVTPDGRLNRYRVAGDKPGRRNGWYVLHLDGVPGGAFGSWSAGVHETWCARDRATLSPAEKVEQRRRVEAAREERNRERERKHAAAAERARRLWGEAGPADAAHPYLKAKRVQPHHARQRDDRLVLPVVTFGGEVVSLQCIGPSPGGERNKVLLTGGRKQGCVIPVARGQEGGRVLICEGWATGATLAEENPTARVMAAIDAGNLEPVAVAARRAWPEADIVICGDADPIGEKKARNAALTAEALVAIPAFPEGASGSDFNDLANLATEGGDHD